jgi:hypothetical protein
MSICEVNTLNTEPKSITKEVVNNLDINESEQCLSKIRISRNTKNYLSFNLMNGYNNSSNNNNNTKNMDKTLFTFKPKLNAKSNQIAQNLLNFYERQNLHSQKQLEIVNLIIKNSFCLIIYILYIYFF